MRMFIHSCYGVLEAKPMTLQAIKDSIPEPELIEQNKVVEGETVEAEDPQTEE